MIAEWERLPRRDWIVLPLLSLLSVFLVLGASEIVARVVWPEQQRDACTVADPVFGFHFKPNCVARVKSVETPWVENAYNACGFRTAQSCGPKPPGGFRVAVLGSSISSGYLVPYPQTFAARAQVALERRCHIPVDFQNLAVPGTGLEKAPLHLGQALRLRPDLLLMAISAHDLEVLPASAAAGSEISAAPTQATTPARPGLGESLRRLVVEMRASRASLVAQHFLYENLDSYLPLYLKHGDEADFLRPPFSDAWRRRLTAFDREIAEMSARARAGGAPLMLVFVPQRAQALLLRWKSRPAGIDPALLGRTLGRIARDHGVAYVDLTQTIGERADVSALYYPVDSHPNAAASAIVADSVIAGMMRQDALRAVCRDHGPPGA